MALSFLSHHALCQGYSGPSPTKGLLKVVQCTIFIQHKPAEQLAITASQRCRGGAGCIILPHTAAS